MAHARRPGRMAAALAILAGWQAVAAGQAAAQSGPGRSPLAGTWSGEYICSQGLTGVTLTVTRGDPDDVRALFHLYTAPTNPSVPTGCFEMAGRYDPASGQVQLYGGRWLLRPTNYVVVDFLGRLDAASGALEGLVKGPGCTVFQLARRPSPRRVPPECRPRDDTVARLGGARSLVE